MARLIRYGSITMTDNINHWWLSPNLTIADKLLKQKNWSKIFGQLLIIYITLHKQSKILNQYITSFQIFTGRTSDN